MSTWNMNGFANWKRKHKDFMHLLQTNDIISLTETWLNDVECELICSEFSSDYKVMYSCRRKNKNAKRDSGGIMVFIKNSLSKYIEVAEHKDEDILWLKAKTQSGQNSIAIYICCTYISPKSSCRYQLEDVSKLDVLHNNIVKFKNKGHVIILGDINCRTGTEDDFIDVRQVKNFVQGPEDEDIHIDDLISVNNCVNKQRRSEDNVVNENGRELLKICKTDNIFIVNGRIGNMIRNVSLHVTLLKGKVWSITL